MSGAPTRLLLIGASGRMGQRLSALAEADPGLRVAAKVDAEGPSLSDVAPAAVDCVIDFSVREQLAATTRWCADAGRPLVLGTTGLAAADRQALDQAAQRVPIVWAPNFSVGVNVLFSLAGEMAKLLGTDFELEVVEAHHRHKVDAPSGTARRLVEVLAESRGTTYEEAAVTSREGLCGPRTAGEIGVSVVRGGDVVGEHTVLYLSTGEELRLTHKATDRDVFARGALRAAAWLASTPRAPRVYDMLDVLRNP